ncbi:MAG: oxidoreductase [Mogibacterium sp.]|nr:oxidoreductase [Mogibacterium sp.]
MKQTSRITSTYSADTMGVCSALFELGGMTIMHDASGCNSTYTTHDEPRWYDMDSMVYISALTEMEAIMGDDEKLLGDIEDAVRELHPKFVAIAGTPIPTMTGFDFEAVAAVAEQRTGVPCFGFATTGMNTYIHGVSMAFETLAKRVVKDIKTEKKKELPSDNERQDVQEESFSKHTDSNQYGSHSTTPKKLKVNIIGLTPLDFSVNGQDSSIASWLESENFEVVSRWAMGSTLEEIAMAGEADVNLVVSASGLAAAKVLFERFGMPYAVGLPIGHELPGAFADLIKTKVREFKEADASAATFESREISIHSGIFLAGSDSQNSAAQNATAERKNTTDSVQPYKKGFTAIIGEGVASFSLANAVELDLGIPAKVLCTTECPEDMLRECDRITPDEDDIIPELEGAAYIIADPLYKPICPPEAKFIPLPSEGFSGRLYRDEIPNLITDFEDFLKKRCI